MSTANQNPGPIAPVSAVQAANALKNAGKPVYSVKVKARLRPFKIEEFFGDEVSINLLEDEEELAELLLSDPYNGRSKAAYLSACQFRALAKACNAVADTLERKGGAE